MNDVIHAWKLCNIPCASNMLSVRKTSNPRQPQADEKVGRASKPCYDPKFWAPSWQPNPKQYYTSSVPNATSMFLQHVVLSHRSTVGLLKEDYGVALPKRRLWKTVRVLSNDSGSFKRNCGIATLRMYHELECFPSGTVTCIPEQASAASLALKGYASPCMCTWAFLFEGTSLGAYVSETKLCVKLCVGFPTQYSPWPNPQSII